MSANSTPHIRSAARALIVDDDQRVLLFRGDLPDREPWWFAPGGALEPGETYEAALVREVLEETGLAIDVTAVGPPVWARDHMFRWQDRLERHLERFFLILVSTHEVETIRMQPEERRTYRWWWIDEIMRSSERFSPMHAGVHLSELLQHGPPIEPIAIGD